MKKKMVVRLLLVLIAIAIVYVFILPRTFSQMQSKAYLEFDMYVQDNNLKGNLFKGPELLPMESYLVFRWLAVPNNRDTLFLDIRVPESKFRETVVTGSGDPKLWKELQKP